MADVHRQAHGIHEVPLDHPHALRMLSAVNNHSVRRAAKLMTQT